MHTDCRSARYRTVALALLAVMPGASLPALPAPAHAQSASPSNSTEIARHVAAAAQRYDIPDAWIWAVMGIESGGDPAAISPKGAMGLMQIMPTTWTALRSRHGLGGDPYDVRDNIMAGAAYLRAMLDRYGDPTAMLAAYHAGPGRYDEYLRRGRPLPAVTRAYVARLAPRIGIAPTPHMAPPAIPDPLAWTRSALFAARATMASDRGADDVTAAPDTQHERVPDAPQMAAMAAPTPPSRSLFVPLSGRPSQ
ncbi:hypothetical protein MB02_08165 [Croceicoccus estronivorus]|uniref:lytic transglycosylase domain-containing protein n=1 Tax=Croceicoccus estronivorus TaxID=1172626 RepID=UPI00082C5FA0|nr:lytic transglycosylase domain-containing protein [Croceicoccus estronivorus]OCC23804.1 hypothetical protein MB02_08165 [Croceicoccus estronivorus]